MFLTKPFRSEGIAGVVQALQSTGMSENWKSPKRFVGLYDLDLVESRELPLSEEGV